MLSSRNYYNWSNSYQRKSNPILKGKKAHNVIEILLGLSQIGPSTTREIAHFVLSHLRDYQENTIRDKDVRIKEQIYYKLIHGRLAKKSGKKKVGKYPGLLDNLFVIGMGSKINQKSKIVNLYFLPLKGCFLVLGTNFDNNQLAQFVNNAAKNHLFFAYLKRIMIETSPKFIQSIFVQPIFELIEKDLIRLDNFQFYFGIISDAISDEIYKRYDRAIVRKSRRKLPQENFKPPKNYEILIKHTFYDPDLTHDTRWMASIDRYFYPNLKDEEFYQKYSDQSAEYHLVRKIMRAVHFAYFNARNLGIPIRHLQKLPLPKELAKHLADKKKNLQRNRKIDEELKRLNITEPTVVDRVRVAKELGI